MNDGHRSRRPDGDGDVHAIRGACQNDTAEIGPAAKTAFGAKSALVKSAPKRDRKNDAAGNISHFKSPVVPFDFLLGFIAQFTNRPGRLVIGLFRAADFDADVVQNLLGMVQ